ncbi:MAG: SpoIIE family protein phosphatase [Bacteroidales bacterium]|nr:SpoIIE family protein phosphatase [Bacteroidales bacterium]MCB9013871.1 SpoIIE family protein phosphatase [Bacteroidales bacterium]
MENNSHNAVDLSDSIRYASKIQSALLPEREYFKKILPYSFILYLPKDVVSGDFYWIKKRENRIGLAAADCTGHGVPGAFMSIMGINFLNQISSVCLGLSNIILNQLREYVMKALNQKGENEDQKDGMDIACCVIDTEKRQLEFSGANNPLIYFKDKEMKIVKADRMPIGVGPVEEESFRKNIIPFDAIDKFYIFSDGYADQFGGEGNKKLKLKGFYQILNEIQEYPFEQHEELLHNRIKTWMGDNEQVDDILLIGIDMKKIYNET